MTQINPNFNNRYLSYQPKFKSKQEEQVIDNSALEEEIVNNIPEEETYVEEEVGNQLPEIYDEGPYRRQKTPKEVIKSVDVMGFVSPWIEHPILMTGTAGTLIYGIDRFSEACGGEYEKSVLGKITRAGDRLENSKFMKKDGTQKVLNTTKRYYDKIKTKIRNSTPVKAMLDTPCIPEKAMAKCEFISQEQRIVQDNFHKIVESLKLGSDEMFELKLLGVDKGEKELIKNFFKVNKLSAVAEDKATNFIILKRLKLSDSEIQKVLDLGENATKETKKKLLETMGTTVDDIAKFKADDTGKYVKDIFEISKKGKGKIWTGAGEYGILGPFQPFKRKIGMDQLHNNLLSLKDGAKTATGRFFAKATHLIHRGFTFGGGKLGMLMFIAPHLMHTIVNTIKAEPEEKVSTAVQGSIGSISWVLTFPLAIRSVYQLGGLKHMGMSKDAVDKYRNLIKDFNNKTFADKKAYNEARKALKKEINALWKVKDQNFLTTMTRKIAKIFTCDLGQIKPFESKNMLANMWHKKGKFFKNLGNEPLRFISVMAISFLLDAIITKTFNALLGKTHDESLEEMNQDMKKQQEEFAINDLREKLKEANDRKIEAEANPQETSLEETVPTIVAPPINLAERFADMPRNKAENAINKKQPIQEQIIDEEPVIVEEKTPEPIKEKTQPEKIEKEIEKNQITEKVVTEKENKKNTEKIAQARDEVANKYIPSPYPNPELFNKKTEKRDNYTYIPSSENVIKNNTNPTEQLKYIPSQLAGNFTKTFDNSGLQKALARADRAEQQALQVLAGKFGPM